MRRLPCIVLLVTLLWACGARVVHSGVNQWTPIGPQARSIFALAIDPITPATLYAATDSGVFQSTNGGDSWKVVNTGLPGGRVDVLAIDPAMPATLYAGRYTDGVFKSTDGGASWSAINTGLTNLAIQVLDINHPTLYAGTDGGGLFAITFTFRTFLLAVVKAGNGTVTSSPPGVTCGATCSASFDEGTSVTLTATLAPGTFTGWSGEGCSGTSPCTVSMTQARTVTASFALRPQVTLTVSKAGMGSGTVASTPAGISCGSICSATVDVGTSVTLTASAASGSTFTGWSGEGCSGTGPCAVSMTQARTVTASFTSAPAAPLPANGGGGNGGCTINPGARFDPMIIGMAGLSLACLVWGRFRKGQK